MRRLWRILLLSLSAILLVVAGCGQGAVSNGDSDRDVPYISGLIYAEGDNYVLVVEGIEAIDVPYETWFENGHAAVHFYITKNTVIQGFDGSSLSLQELKPGMTAQVWVKGEIRESYPEQAEAKRIVIIRDKVPQSPDETEKVMETPGAGQSDNNDTNDNRKAIEREVEITIPGLLRALSITREGNARPETKELPFGNRDEEIPLTFRLVNSPWLPFSTYIPGESSYSGFRLLTHGHLHGVYPFIEEELPPHGGNFKLLRISDARPEDSHMGQYLDILFLESSTGIEKARQYLKLSLEPAESLVLLEGPLPDWLVEAYMFGGKGDLADLLGFAALGTYKGQFFLLYSVWNRAGEAAWLPAVRLILEKWYWKTAVHPRPLEQVFTVFTEGDEHHVLCHLIDFTGVPFTAYFPADTQLMAQYMQTGQLQGVRLGHMDIMFFPGNMTKREAELEFELVLSYLGDMTAVSVEEVPLWALAKYTGWERNSSKTAIFGEYRGRFFYIREQYPPEYGDGWSPIRSILLSTWRWTDSGMPLR